MKRSYLVKIVGLIGIIFCATKIFASTITVEEVGVFPRQVITAHLDGFYNGGVLAGKYEIKIIDAAHPNGVLTDSYCVDFMQYSPSGPTGYDLMDLPSDLKYKEAAWIMRNYPPGGDYDQVVNAQVAIWEILSADAEKLGYGQVSFLPWSGNGNIQDAQTIVDTVLSLSTNPNYFKNFDTTGFKLVYNNQYQDYMVSPVPEPPTILLLGGGLIGLFAFRKKLKFNRKESNDRSHINSIGVMNKETSISSGCCRKGEETQKELPMNPSQIGVELLGMKI